MEKQVPAIFNKTIYRLPTYEELVDVNKYNLTFDEIINGFKYTIIGRGIKDEKSKKMIYESILILTKLFPNNPIYKEALEKISQEYGELNENRVKQIIIEEISAIRKDKDDNIFDYTSIIDDAWRDKINEAQEFQRINFDLENNNTTGEKKTFYVKKDLRKDQPIKYEFNVELMKAGGDWERPVMYFRLEFTHDYFYGNNDNFKNKPEFIWDLDKKSYAGLYDCYVIIPPVEAGNALTKGKSDSGKYDWFAYQNDGLTDEEEKEAEITDAKKKTCWKWLEDLLQKLVEDRHEMLDK